MADRSKVDEEIVRSYRTVARALDRYMLPLLIELGLTMSQFKALIAVTSAGPGGISITQLGSELAIGQPSASLIVDQIERPGYVERIPDADDRRRVLVTATAKGLEITAELRHGRRATFHEWLDNISDEDAKALDEGLRALANAVQASTTGGSPVH